MQIDKNHVAFVAVQLIQRGNVVRVYQEFAEDSDVSVIDTEQFGDNGIEIHTRDHRTWSTLDAQAALEQLGVLRDQYGLLVPEQCINALEAERGFRAMVAFDSPVTDWSLAAVPF